MRHLALRAAGRVAAAIVLLLCAALLAAAGAQATTQAPTVRAQTALSPVDYATDVFGDPWDYANAADLWFTPDRISGVTNLRLEDGALRYDTDTGSTLTFVFPGYPGALPIPVHREGRQFPIDADVYSHLALRMFTSAPDLSSAGVFWDRCLQEVEGGPPPDCRGGLNFVIEPGSNTYLLPLRELTAGQEFGWRDQIYALYMSYGNISGPTSVAIDWLRLHPGDRDPETLDQLPVPVFDDPDYTGGEDYATAQTGDPWDFTAPSDVIVLRNAADVSFGPDGLAATNAPPNQNDPHFYLRTGLHIDPSRYHRLTVVTSYDGPFGLGFGPGGGAHGRLSWARLDGDQDRVIEGDKVLQSKELVHYPGIDTMTVDLITDPAAALMEDDLPSRAGWTGSPITHLRWDPNEDPGARRWRVRSIHLRADDEARGSFDIRWHEANPAVDPQATTVSLYYDTDRAGFDGELIVADLDQQPGTNTYRWNTTDVAPGSYWLYAVATNAAGTAARYASGPLRVVPNIRIAGPNRVATAVALAQSGFPAGAEAVVVARDADFPDALAAAPLAAAAGGPLLLNPRDELHPAVADEVRRLGPDTVYLMGGQAAQSSDVEAALDGLGVHVVRVSGPDRYATAAAAAAEAVELWRDGGDPQAGRAALVALGTDFPDALAAGPLAGHGHQPLLLVARDAVPQATLDALEDFGAREVTVVGGTATVPQDTAAELEAPGRQVRRLAGPSRFDTAAAAAEAAVAAGAEDGVVFVAAGRAFPDALAAGPAVIARGGVLLLTERESVPGATRAWLEERTISLLRVAGGAAAVSDPTVEALAAAATR